MNEITEQQLAAMLSTSDAATRAALWTEPLNQGMARMEIDRPLRQAAFLAQVLLESSEFRQLQESLNYSVARLREVWPKRFPSDEVAVQYAQQPEKLANRVYADRMGNGDEASGDGWRYRGRGLIQLTGRENYARFANAAGIDALGQPDLLAGPPGAVLSAAWFWHSRGLNELADRTQGPDGNAAFVELTTRINGGVNGLAQRHAYWDRVRKVLAVAA